MGSIASKFKELKTNKSSILFAEIRVSPITDKNAVELDILSELVSEYEDEHFPINQPSLVDVMKLRMFEMGLNQAKLSELLGVSPSRISDIFTGRCEPTLKVAREICRKMNVDARIVLGV